MATASGERRGGNIICTVSLAVISVWWFQKYVCTVSLVVLLYRILACNPEICLGATCFGVIYGYHASLKRFSTTRAHREK